MENFVSHESLREWAVLNKIKMSDMAEAVGKTSISHYQFKPYPIEWLLKWQQIYGWTDDQLFRYAFGRPLRQLGESVLSEETVVNLVAKGVRKALGGKE